MTNPRLPLVALPSDRIFSSGYEWQAAAEQYLFAASDVAKVAPIIVPSLQDHPHLDSVLDMIDGVLITGAKSNVHPSLYGIKDDKNRGPFDNTRDHSSFALIHAALERSIPLLAICRGIQELNVALGGTLTHGIQNLPGRDDHRAPESAPMDERYKIHQSVNISEHGCLSAIIGSGHIMVNTVHEQGIENLAPRLQVEAKADDGTIEAVSVKNADGFALGLQWHPEYWVKTDTPSRQIFEAFGKAVYAHQTERLR